MAEKWSEGWAVIDEYVDARIAASDICPWADLVEEMIAKRHFGLRAGYEKRCERQENAGGKERDQ